MRKASKKIFFILSIMVVFFTFQIISTYKYLSSIRFMLKDNFSIDIPKPKREIKVLSDINAIPLDGKAYSVLEYDETSARKLTDFNEWKKVDKDSQNEVNKFVDQLKKYQAADGTKKAMLNQYKPRLQDKSLYYFKPKKNDYVILLYNEDEKRIYVMEHIDRVAKYSVSYKK